MKKFIVLPLLILATGIFFSSCEEDEPEIPNEEEVITTLILTFTPDGGGADVEFRFTDLDGDGGNAPTITTGDLAAATTYNVAVRFLNEAETPAEEITTEVSDEAEEHQVFFDDDLGLTIAYNDADADANPIGLDVSVTTTAAGTGTMTVTLIHEPNKSAAGVSDGDITNAGGETDIEVSFPVNII